VPSQQPKGQLQTQHSLDTDNYIIIIIKRRRSAGGRRRGGGEGRRRRSRGGGRRVRNIRKRGAGGSRGG
jgi:hypothetical protein